MLQVLIAVGDHRTAAIPAASAHDVHGINGKGVGGSHDGANIGVVFEILNRDVQRVPAGIDIGDNRFTAPIAIGVDDVAAVTIDKQLRIIVLIGGQLAFPGANAVAAFIPFGGAGLLSFHLQAQVRKVEQVAVFKAFGGDDIGGTGRAVHDGSNTNDLSASFAQRGDGSQRRVAGGGRIFND